MSRKRKNNTSNTEKLIAQNKSEDIIYTDTEPVTGSIDEEGYSDYGDFSRGKKHNCKYNCEELCSKYMNNDCNFACASDRELLITILCVLKDENYGLKAIGHDMKKSELNNDLKNIKSITDLLERAIVGLGETAVGAVKKAVDAAGTMTDITSGLAKIAAGTAQTAGSLAFTSSGLASVAAGTAQTAGSLALTSSGLASAAAGTVQTAAAASNAVAATSGAAANIAAEAAGAAAAGAVIAGAGADIAAEGSGIGAAAAGTVGSAADIISESAGVAAGTAATVGAAGDIAAEAAGAAGTTTFNTGAITPERDEENIQVWFLNNNTQPSGTIEFTIYNTKVNPKSVFYTTKLVVSPRSSVSYTIYSIPASYEIQIQGLDERILVYAVVLSKSKVGSNTVKPSVDRILFMHNSIC